MQQAGLHTGRQSRDTEEEGLQQEEVQQAGWQLDCWQHEEEPSEQVGTQQTGLQQTGTQQTGLQQTGTQQACWQGEEVQQAGWQLDCWQHEGVQELVQPDWQGLGSQAAWQQGLDTQLTGVQTRVRQEAGAQQLGAQQGGSQQLSGQSSTCQESEQALEQTDMVDAAMLGCGGGQEDREDLTFPERETEHSGKASGQSAHWEDTVPGLAFGSGPLSPGALIKCPERVGIGHGLRPLSAENEPTAAWDGSNPQPPTAPHSPSLHTRLATVMEIPWNLASSVPVTPRPMAIVKEAPLGSQGLSVNT
ncbi:hypothetical protein P7K49_032429 [Saguinus oedipus]|uniref:Uncharacterized protein n=1 Tax=Saguinus oedipus TaxID=9490 RepID=A0ABQ9TY81_SAGOE|nr:hypothetical protein P7K49_032429 [Saguinus oedipus]